MPARAKGARLYLRRERRDKRTGQVTHAAVWLIRDGAHSRSTGCVSSDIAGAEAALAAYVAGKHAKAISGRRNRHPDSIPIADVLTLYARNKIPAQARPKEAAGRLDALYAYWGGQMLSAINGDTCRDYAARRPAAAGRRELEDLRAAINYHRRENLCSEIVSVWLPPAPIGRQRWLTRSEAARILWAAWRYRERQNFRATDRHTRRHIARFILIAIYTGTRSAAICGAALCPMEDRGWIDLERGVFYRRAAGRRETKKRQPPIPLPPQLLAHLRRWRRKGQRFAVEWNGQPVGSIAKAFGRVAADAGLSREVTPHVLRHTAATWLMQAGTDLWQAAGYLGMTVEMLIERYGHHHPDHLSGALRAFNRRREAVAEAVAKPISISAK